MASYPVQSTDVFGFFCVCDVMCRQKYLSTDRSQFQSSTKCLQKYSKSWKTGDPGPHSRIQILILGTAPSRVYFQQTPQNRQYQRKYCLTHNGKNINHLL